MKTLRRFLIIISMIAVVGFGLYYFGTALVADKVVERYEEQIEMDGDISPIKNIVENDPIMKAFVEQGATIDSNTMPFTTKEDAVKTIVRRIGVKELQQIQSSFQDGLTQQEKQALIETMETKLTADEMDAIKAIMYNELNK